MGKFGIGIVFATFLSSLTCLALAGTVNSREDSGPGTLRQVIADAVVGESITFNVAGGNSITVYSSITLDKRLTIDGGGMQVVGASDAFMNIFNIISGAQGTVIQGLSLVNAGRAINLYGTNNVQILNCRLGVDWSDVARGNGWGLMVEDANGTVIGGPGNGNVISGNSAYGIVLKNSTNTIIQANRIGTNSAGNAVCSNQIGIRVLDGSLGTLIGGDAGAGAGNLVSGNLIYGIEISNSDGYGGFGAHSSGNTVAGNVIGLSLDQTVPLANGNWGVYLRFSEHNQIGMNLPRQGNVITGNGSENMEIWQANSNCVQNNLIGVNSNNQIVGSTSEGIQLDNAWGNLIGGNQAAAAYERNVISGHTNYGLVLAALSSGNTVAGNYIGVDITGNTRVANDVGVLLTSAMGNLIGGDNLNASNNQGNVLAGNLHDHLLVQGGASNRIFGNTIGLNANGNANAASGSVNERGIYLCNNTHDNWVGFGLAKQRNVISALGNIGMYIDSGSYNNRVQGNYFGTNLSGTQQIKNAAYDILVDGSSNLIGGTTLAEGNLICSGTGCLGILFGRNGSGNTAAANCIGVLANGGLPAEALSQGVEFQDHSINNWLGFPNGGPGNLIANAQDGIVLGSGAVHDGLFANTVCACSAGPMYFSDSTCNNNKAKPNIISAFPSQIAGTAEANNYVEVFKAEAIPGSYGGSLKLLGHCQAGSDGHWAISPAGISAGDLVCAQASDNLNNTSMFSLNTAVIIPTATPTATISPTATVTPTLTVTPVLTATGTVTASPTVTATPTFSWNEDGVRAFPNPGKERISFIQKLDQPAEVALSLYNFTGERVAELKQSFEAGVAVLVWDCHTVAPGI